jgi:hypothetical protein
MKVSLDLLPAERKTVYSFYKLEFSENGVPMKRMGENLVFHPILVPYLIDDFLKIYESKGVDEALEIAVYIAKKALEYSEQYHGAIVFWYDPEDGLSSMPYRFYSGLTQSWYVKAFAKLSTYETFFTDITEMLFNSLLITIEDGGVLLKKDFGWVVEEYPFAPPLYTLNGWLTVIRWLVENEKLLNGLKNFNKFIANNIRAISHLLPLYDAGFVSNSRYQLTGFTRFKLVFDKPGITRDVNSFSVGIPGDGEHVGSLEKRTAGRWENFLERDEGRLIQFNIVQSLVSFPETNKFLLELYASESCEIRCYLADGDYSPDLTGLPTQRWRELKKVKLVKGVNNLVIDLEWDDTNMFAYPTNFKKDIYQGKGKKFNAYHYVHIADLASIYAYSGNQLVKKYCFKWIGYLDLWKDMECLDKNKVSINHYLGDRYMANVYKKLEVVQKDNA